MPFVAISLALAALSAGAGVYGAVEQNKAVKRSMKARREAAVVQKKQIDRQSEVEKKRTQIQAAQIRGRIRVAGAAAGTGLGGTFGQLIGQADQDELFNTSVIEGNRIGALNSADAGLQVDLSSLGSQGQNTLLQAFQGALQGASTGLAISNAVGQAESLDSARKALELERLDRMRLAAFEQGGIPYVPAR